MKARILLLIIFLMNSLIMWAQDHQTKPPTERLKITPQSPGPKKPPYEHGLIDWSTAETEFKNYSDQLIKTSQGPGCFNSFVPGSTKDPTELFQLFVLIDAPFKKQHETNHCKGCESKQDNAPILLMYEHHPYINCLMVDPLFRSALKNLLDTKRFPYMLGGGNMDIFEYYDRLIYDYEN